ncbi:energy-coupled thiamine transporter ThiT [Brevibacillus invocatus]|uniref:energy-coupled thiamine transporter ThiT n=1 Tax=Brevibacillus invocatus TaxID=173959 RepID=UPI00203BCB32|nr:energy-coupled thiamine transporter ThiT [Brevibacillus invocatus]MCM3430091.1 energy-coupled thiamine transporter ThiT [Brevibacillus invocatus]
MDRNRLLTLLEMAMMAALALVFSEIKVFTMPQGGSVSLVMVPIALLAVRRGIIPGIVTGLIVGLLQLFLGGYVVHPIQLLLDYPVAFAALGFVGIVRISHFTSKPKRNVAIWSALLVGVLVRFACHFTSGIVWFGEFAPEGMNVAWYSFVYNITYLLPEMVISGIVLSIVLGTAPQLLQPARNRLA